MYNKVRSIGFDIVDQDVEYQDGEPTVWIIKKVRLYEVSVVTFPAYDQALTIPFGELLDFVAIEQIKAEGFSRKKNTTRDEDVIPDVR